MHPKEIKDAIIEKLDVPFDVDFIKLYEVNNLVEKVTSVVLGVIAYGIIILLTIVTAVDIAYITIPVFREAVQRARWDGTKAIALKLVSKDAIASVEWVTIYENNKSPLGVYLKKRLWTYIISMGILTIILGGSETITNIVVSTISTIVENF